MMSSLFLSYEPRERIGLLLAAPKSPPPPLLVDATLALISVSYLGEGGWGVVVVLLDN